MLRNGGKLHVFHGGKFKRLPNLIYSESKCIEVQIDLDLLSVDDINDVVSK